MLPTKTILTANVLHFLLAQYAPLWSPYDLRRTVRAELKVTCINCTRRASPTRLRTHAAGDNMAFPDTRLHRCGRVTGGPYSEAGDDGNLIWSVRFIGNSALALGGAMELDEPKLLQVSGATFDSNSAPLGGAVYVVSVYDRQTNFDNCVFEGNEAEDGGAFYLYTGSGVDIFTASIFRGNFAGWSP